MVEVGVIGVGTLGQHHARLYASLPGVRLVTKKNQTKRQK